MKYFNLIEEILVENGICIEDYTNPLKGITKYDAIESAIKNLYS